MNKKGQGALEYLLLIGGAILVAVVVITILSGIGTQGGAQTEANAVKGICAARQPSGTPLTCGTDITIGNTLCVCSVNTSENGCIANTGKCA